MYNYYVYLYLVFRFLPSASRETFEPLRPKEWPEPGSLPADTAVLSRVEKNAFLLLKGQGVMELWSYWISENEVHLHGKNMIFMKGDDKTTGFRAALFSEEPI